MRLAYLISLWFLVSIPVAVFLGKLIRAGRGGERSAVMAESVEHEGVMLTFYAGPLGTQMVQVNVGSEFKQMTLVEWCELCSGAQNILMKRMRERNLIR